MRKIVEVQGQLKVNMYFADSRLDLRYVNKQLTNLSICIFFSAEKLCNFTQKLKVTQTFLFDKKKDYLLPFAYYLLIADRMNQREATECFVG